VLPNSPKVKPEPGPPMTLGNAAAARVWLILWCKECQHQVEPDPAEMAQRYAGTAVLEWRERLGGSRRDSRRVDMVARVKCARGPLMPPRIMSRGRPSIAHLSLLRQPRGDLVVPNAPPVPLPSTPVAREWGRDSARPQNVAVRLPSGLG
jgi:hypothetical protein